MFYSDNFRFEGPDEFEGIDDADEINGTNAPESYEVPFDCPYRQADFFSYDYDYMSRQPGPAQPPHPLQPPHMPQPPHPQQQPGPPPHFTPSQTQTYGHQGPQTTVVESGALRRCMYRHIYIWPRRGRGFWAWLTFVGRRSVAGYRWNGYRWVYFGMDLREIESFICY